MPNGKPLGDCEQGTHTIWYKTENTLVAVWRMDCALLIVMVGVRMSGWNQPSLAYVLSEDGSLQENRMVRIGIW